MDNNQKIKIIAKNLNQTQEAAKNLIEEILATYKGKTIVLALEGELGSAKTSFTQGLGRALKIEGKITSPTFVIMKRYGIPSSSYKFLYHLDCYRLKDKKDVLELGFEEILKNDGNILVIEWPEKIQDVLSKENTIWIKFEHIKEGRRITFMK